MPRPALLALALLAAGNAYAYDANDWPTHFTTDGGYEFGVKGTYQADVNRFSDDTLPNGRDDFEDFPEEWLVTLRTQLEQRRRQDRKAAVNGQASTVNGADPF